MRFPFILGSVATAMVLSACGGGDGCSSQETISLTTAWTVTGGTASNAGGGKTDLKGTVGVPFSATPKHTGIPASCAGEMLYRQASFRPLPDGITLNEKTGVISGTAKAFVPSGTGVLQNFPQSYPIYFSLPGYSELQIGSVSFAKP